VRSRLSRRHQAAAIAAAIAALAIAGCSGSATASGAGSSSSSPAASPPASPSSASAGQHVTLAGTNGLKFTPMTVHVKTGTVRITLTDQGAYPHNLVIPTLHIKSSTVSGTPGENHTTVTVRFPHPGRFSFYCQYHRSSGMTGVFVVS
jgi:plastocyanin